MGHLIGPRRTWDRLIGFITETVKNDRKALEKTLSRALQKHLKTHVFDYDYNITSDLNTIFDSVEDVKPKIITRMMPSVRRLMGKAEKDLDEEDIKLKKKVKDALKLLMTKEGLSVDALKNDTDVSMFWDVMGTYFVNSRKIGNETLKNEDLQRKRGADLHLGLGLGLTLVFLCAAGAVILFCT